LARILVPKALVASTVGAMARGCPRFLSAGLLAGVVAAGSAAPGGLRAGPRPHARRRENQTCLERALAASSPGEVGQFRLRVLNYDNAWHVTCRASGESLVLDLLLPGVPATFFGPLLALELQRAAWPDIPAGSIEANALVTSLNGPDHASVPSLNALINQTHKVPVLTAYAQSLKGSFGAAILDVIGYSDYGRLAAWSTFYPDCSPTADGTLQFQTVGDFRVCYAGREDSVVQFRTLLVASSCGVLLHAPHGVEGPFEHNLLRAISQLRAGKRLVAIIGTSQLYQFGQPTKSFGTVREAIGQLKPDAFFDTHRQEYFDLSGLAWAALGSRVFHVERVAPEDVCNAFPKAYKGSPSRKDNPLQVPVYGQS